MDIERQEKPKIKSKKYLKYGCPICGKMEGKYINDHSDDWECICGKQVTLDSESMYILDNS